MASSRPLKLPWPGIYQRAPAGVGVLVRELSAGQRDEEMVEYTQAMHWLEWKGLVVIAHGHVALSVEGIHLAIAMGFMRGEEHA